MAEGSLEVKPPTVWTDGKAGRWESRGGKSQRRGEKIREEKVRRKKESREILCFSNDLWLRSPEGRKVGSPKQRVRSHLARWEMKNWTRCGTKHMWKSKCREHLTFGPLSWDVEKVHAIVARSTCPSQNVHARHSRSTFGSWHVEKVHAIVVRSTCPSQNVKNTTCSDYFWTFRCRFAWQAQRTVSKVSRTWRLCSSSKSVGSRGTFEEGPQRYIFRGRRSARDMSIWDVRRSGRWFPERGWGIKSSVLGKWFCVTGAALRMTWPHFFVAGAVL